MSNATRTVTVPLQIELRAPTCIALRPASPGQVSETLPYLPGTTIRGALAQRWLAGRRLEALPAREMELFQNVMLTGTVQFHHAWPEPEQPREQRTEIVPLTAAGHKRDPGWINDNGKGVIDLLAPLLRLRRVDDPALADQIANLERLEQRFAQVEGRSWHALKVRRRLISRTAVNPMLGPIPRHVRDVASDGQLYSIVALEAGQLFRTRIQGPAALIGSLAVHTLGLPPDTAEEALAEQVRTLLANQDLLVTLGQGRSRGLGQARLRIASSPNTQARDPARLAVQAEAFSRRAGLPTTEGFFLPVTVESDLLLRDRYLNPSSTMAPTETLSRYRPLSSDGTIRGTPFTMTLVESVLATRWLGGWDELRRLPRPPLLALQPGSVAVFQVGTSDLTTAIGWWQAVERDGIGERTAEGFGHVRLLHPLHADEGRGGLW